MMSVSFILEIITYLTARLFEKAFVFYQYLIPNGTRSLRQWGRKGQWERKRRTHRKSIANAGSWKVQTISRSVRKWVGAGYCFLCKPICQRTVFGVCSR